MEVLPVNNTFIHVQFVDSVVANAARRSRSEPPLLSARLECHHPRSMSKGQASTCSSNTCSSSSSSSNNKELPCNGADYDSKTPTQKQKRPCKAQRGAFKKYMNDLKKQLSENPQAFSLEDFEVPKRFRRPGSKNKVAKLLADFFKEVSGPVAHSKIQAGDLSGALV